MSHLSSSLEGGTPRGRSPDADRGEEVDSDNVAPLWLRWLALGLLVVGLMLWDNGWACRGSGRRQGTSEQREKTVPAQPGTAPARPEAAPARTTPDGQLPASIPAQAVSPDPQTLFHGRLGALTHGRPVEGADDLDGDGRPDRWKAVAQGGSGFGGVTLTLASSRRAKTFTLETYGSFGQFLGTIRLPSDMAALPPLVQGTVRLLFGEPHLRVLSSDPAPKGALPEGFLHDPPLPSERADGSFEWLEDKAFFAPLPKQAPFLSRRLYRPFWSPGPPAAPKSQVALLSYPRGARLVRALAVGDAPDLLQSSWPTGSPLALLAYHAHNHGPLREVGRCGAWTLFATAHGVAVLDTARQAHSWVYVSTDVVKLRWGSIGRVACLHGLVVLERDTRDSVELVVVDPVAGRYGLLPFTRGESWSLEAKGKGKGRGMGSEKVNETGSETGSGRAGKKRGVLTVGRRSYLLSALRAALGPPPKWQQAFDLDGDGRPDRIDVTFSGGAHCCYRLRVHSSRSGRAHSLPIELDGGYVRGLDLSRPEQLHVADYDSDGLPDLFVQIATYNGVPQPIPPAWTKRWGIRSHQVVVSLRGGSLGVRDLQ